MKITTDMSLLSRKRNSSSYFSAGDKNISYLSRELQISPGTYTQYETTNCTMASFYGYLQWSSSIVYGLG